MRVVSRKAIREAAAKHSEWSASLNARYKIAKNADWKHFAEVRNSWRNSDVVGSFVVFDITQMIAGPVTRENCSKKLPQLL